MRNNLLLAASLTLFLTGASSPVQAQLAPTPPAVPTLSPPVTPGDTAPTLLAPPTPGDNKPTLLAPPTPGDTAPKLLIDSIKSDDVEKLIVSALNDADGKSSAWERVVLLNGHSSLPDKRVSVDQKNAKVADVVKDVLGQAKIDYVIEKDVPDDARISLKMDNVKISTALDAITESAGLKWLMDVGPIVESEITNNKVVVRIGKELKPKTLQYFYGDNKINGLKPFFPDGGGPSRYAPLTKGHVSTYTAPAAGVSSTYHSLLTEPPSPFTSIFRSRETRSTFTCPNCKNQITIVHKNVAPKCPTCGRTFEPSWKVCPFDGTKRPEAPKDEWKFCPVCGHPIPEGTAFNWKESDLSFDGDRLCLDDF